jgi:D-amino-acid dehydrogenase
MGGQLSKIVTGQSVIIVGGGIIGINAACFLAEAGYAVTVIDRDGICEGTSAGNAAALAFPSILPLAQKGMLKKVPGWLIDPLGPLTIPPAYFFKVLPWLIKLIKESAPSKREDAIIAQAAMMQLSQVETFALSQRAGTSSMIRNYGSLELYTNAATFSSARRDWDVCAKYDIPFEHVSGARLAQLQPGLSPSVIAATFSPSWSWVSNPKDFGKALMAYAQRLGAKFIQGNVRALHADSGSANIQLSDGHTLHATYVLNCAGAWSHKLAATIGEYMPLETERGYNTTLPASAFETKHMLIFGEDGFVLTPLSNGIRIGGAVELAGLTRPPNFKRADAMLTKAQRYLPDLNTDGGTRWMGYRPSLPDTLPAIGRSKASQHIIHAFGHGHLGLTQAAATGRLLRDIVSGQAHPIDITPFNPHRF